MTKDDNLALAQLFVSYAHSLGLAVGQKNAGEELGSDGKNTAGFDFAVAEECQAYSDPSEDYDECAYYTDAYGDEVLEIWPRSTEMAKTENTL